MVAAANSFWFCIQSEAPEHHDTVDKCLKCLIDNEEPPYRCAQSDNKPADPSMHVKVDDKGVWHRLRIPLPHKLLSVFPGPRTACGKTVSGYYAIKDESYDGDLCKDGCFTPLELSTALEVKEFNMLEEERLSQERDERIAKSLRDSASRYPPMKMKEPK